MPTDDPGSNYFNDAQLAPLRNMTNAEFNAWWDANVTTAAQAIGVLKRLVRVLLRRRAGSVEP